MAQYKHSREDNYEHENPPKRSCSRSNSSLCEADVLGLLADLLFADDDDITSQDLETAQNALVLDMMRSLDQEISSCHKKNSSSVSVVTEGSSIYNHHSGEKPSSSCIVGESPNSSCKIHDETYSVLGLLADLLFADDDDITSQDLETSQNALVLDMMTSLDQEINSCHKKNSSSVSVLTEGYSIYNHHSGENPSSSCIFGESPNSSSKIYDETYSVNIDYLQRATDEELGIPSTSLSDLKKTDPESNFNSHDSENVWDSFIPESSSRESGLYVELLGM